MLTLFLQIFLSIPIIYILLDGSLTVVSVILVFSLLIITGVPASIQGSKESSNEEYSKETSK